MDGLALIEQAHAVGLKLSVVAGKLVMKGPRRLEPLVKLITDNKDSILAVLAGAGKELPDAQPNDISTVGVTETPPNTAKEPGFADSVLAKRKPGQARRLTREPQVPAEIIADPVVLCPRCHRIPVLRELREMTGGLCYACWELEGRS